MSFLTSAFIQIGPHRSRTTRTHKHTQMHMIPGTWNDPVGRAGRHNYEYLLSWTSIWQPIKLNDDYHMSDKLLKALLYNFFFLSSDCFLLLFLQQFVSLCSAAVSPSIYNICLSHLLFPCVQNKSSQTFTASQILVGKSHIIVDLIHYSHARAAFKNVGSFKLIHKNTFNTLFWDIAESFWKYIIPFVLSVST